MKKNVFYVVLMGVCFFSLFMACMVKPADESSKTERRTLAQFPEVTIESIQSGTFMEKFEDYSVDQFPFRDAFRSVKAWTSKYVFRQLDNHGVYVADGQISKLDAVYQKTATEKAIQKFSNIWETYLKDTDVNTYYAVIPDKNYFLAEAHGYPAMDYEAMYQDLDQGLSDKMSYIEIADLLQIDDYYRTDSHWRQDCIQDVAQRIGQNMNTPLTAEYQKVTLDSPFYGVYYGQAALPLKADHITYMESEIFESCTVYDQDHQREIALYDRNKATGRDPYELFLNGSLSAITIENPNAATEKELVIFRDSYGSSIAPFFVEGYQKVTLLDARYLNEKLIGEIVTFQNQDVLFLHCTSVINNEASFKL